MLPRYLLDTNICIYLRKQRPRAVMARFRSLAPGEAAISVITYGELWHGACRHCDALLSEKVEELASLVPPLPMPAEAGAIYGRILALLQRQGRVIGANDLWIAAHALASGLVLVTNNMGEFSRVPDLHLANWVDG